jgi:YhcH/YjgK/YiaL family protein
MALFGSLSTVRSQIAGSPAFQIAFDYVERCLRPGSAEAARIAAVPAGKTERVELGAEVFALEQAYDSKPTAEGKWEAHERFIDIQVVISGRELMGVIETTELRLTEDHRAERDLMFFAPREGGSTLRVGAGGVAVFFPADAHMPSLADGAPALVRKTVVKVPVAAAAARA